MISTAPTFITDATIRELSPALFRAALRMVHHREDAEDLLQNTWLGALRSAPRFEARASVRTWLVAIMRRRLVDFRRDRRRAEQAFDEDEYAASGTPIPDRLDQQAAVLLALRALEDLSEQERAAIALCDIEDLDRERASEQMHVSRSHLRVLLHRGRQKLEHALGAGGMGA